jgi:hypothetical protein
MTDRDAVRSGTHWRILVLIDRLHAPELVDIPTRA